MFLIPSETSLGERADDAADDEFAGLDGQNLSAKRKSNAPAAMTPAPVKPCRAEETGVLTLQEQQLARGQQGEKIPIERHQNLAAGQHGGRDPAIADGAPHQLMTTPS